MRRVSELWKQALARIRFAYSQRLDYRFDRRFGVETMDELLSEELHTDDEAVMRSVRYQPTSSFAFEEMMREVDARHQDFVFLDLGSDKGKALMLATMYRFKRIIGVELSRRIHDIVEVNLASFLERTGGASVFELRCQDAAEIDWPTCDLFIFLFNPFGRQKLDTVFASLARSQSVTPRRLRVLCRRSGAFDELERHSYPAGGSPDADLPSLLPAILRGRRARASF
jgi:hypothetical protein